MNLSLLTNKQMEMRTNKFMIYVFSAIMLGGMVACSSDDPETDTGNGNGIGRNNGCGTRFVGGESFF